MKVYWPTFRYRFENYDAKRKILFIYLEVLFRGVYNITVVQPMTF